MFGISNFSHMIDSEDLENEKQTDGQTNGRTEKRPNGHSSAYSLFTVLLDNPNSVKEQAKEILFSP